MRAKIKIGEKILEILATAGVVGFSALCEGMKDARWVSGGYTDHRVKRSLDRLYNRDLVVKIKTPAGSKWQLTPEGKRLYDQNNLKNVTLNRPEVWDGNWRIVIFDIPEEQGKRVRDMFRNKLKELGFILVQRSVFVCPWPCEEEIMDLAQVLGIDNNVQIVEGKFLTKSEEIKGKFGLSW